jgi:hypothetical protein
VQHITYHGPYDEVYVPAHRLAGVRRLVPVEVGDEVAADLLRQPDNYRASTPDDFEHAAKLADEAKQSEEAKRLRALGKAAAKAIAAQPAPVVDAAAVGASQED